VEGSEQGAPFEAFLGTAVEDAAGVVKHLLLVLREGAWNEGSRSIESDEERRGSVGKRTV